VSFEKLNESVKDLIHLAFAINCWRKVAPICGRFIVRFKDIVPNNLVM